MGARLNPATRFLQETGLLPSPVSIFSSRSEKSNSLVEYKMTKADVQRIQAAVLANPRKMTLQLARDLGVPEAEVIRAFPSDRVTELDITRWEELVRNLQTAGTVRVIVSNGAATAEMEGQFGGFSKTGPFFNVQSSTLDMHVRWEELSAAFAVQKPGHLDGINTLSVQFYDRAGAAAFKVFLNFGEPVTAERMTQFERIRETFRMTYE
jgi:putative hemin transport protein